MALQKSVVVLGPWLHLSPRALQLRGVWCITWGHAAAGAVQISVACAVTGAVVASRPELLPRAMTGSMVLLLLDGVCGDVHDRVRTAVLACYAVMSQPHSAMVLGRVVMPLRRELVLANRKDDPTLRHRRVPHLGSTLELTLCPGGIGELP